MVRYTVRGLNITYHLSRLRDRGVVFGDIVRIDKWHVSMVCSVRYSSLVQQYLTDNGFCDIIVQSLGWHSVVDAIRQHIALAIMIILIVPLLYVNSMYCSGIVVVGIVDSHEVIASLALQGIAKGCRLSDVDYDRVEDSLSSSFDQMYTIVDIRGNTLYVTMLDKVEQVPVVDYTKPRDIVATRDGVVTAISVVQGTPCVRVGQHVSSGQVLIRGVRTYHDDSTMPIYAIGEVSGLVDVSATVNYSGYMSIWEYTDNTMIQRVIHIGARDVISNPCPYDYYDVSSSEVVLHPLPISITYNTYAEKRLVHQEVTFDQYQQHMYSEALDLAQAQADFAIDNTLYSMVEGVSVTVTLYGTVVLSGSAITSGG